MSEDLHCHTVLSDGSMEAEDLILYAKRIGLDTISITNHDTISGVEEAVEFGRKNGVNVIRGVEFSTEDKLRRQKAHLLCYDYKDTSEIEELCRKTLEKRTEAGLIMIERVKKRYPALTTEHVMRYAGKSMSVYKQHITRALMDLGYTNSVFGKVFYELFSSKRDSNVLSPIEYPDVREVLKMIHRAGGKAVLAHPAYYNNFDLFKELITLGIEGVEIYHPRNPLDTREFFQKLADEHGLIKTHGSDFHGMNSSSPVPLGCFDPV